MEKNRTSTRILAIVALLVLIQVGMSIPVHAASLVAIRLYDHGLVRGIKYVNGHFVPLNKTSTVTQDDPYLYAYFTAQLSSANVTWQWIDPSGQLFRTTDQELQCTASPCSYSQYFGIRDSPANTKFGVWRLNLLAGGSVLYSDFFTLTPIVIQENHWTFDVVQSAPPRVQGKLAVTIHPSNLTWNRYQIFMPYAANVTAHEATTNLALNATTNFENNLVTVNLGSPRSDGYVFVLNFDLRYGLQALVDPNSGSFVFTWRERGWERQSNVHPIPETFDITLPQRSTLMDTSGYNALILNQNLTIGTAPTISFTSTYVPRLSGFGWNLIYRDFTWRDAHPQTSTATGIGILPSVEHLLPVLPLTLGGVSLWSAIMSVFLLTGSELLSPIYARTGILIDRRRLRIAALILVAVFLVTTAYRLLGGALPLSR
ncbi:MAG: hypothetical protein ABSD49_11385 [Candidatus Bathyarchaeia archaeon]|jgi:hypothetical protein